MYEHYVINITSLRATRGRAPFIVGKYVIGSNIAYGIVIEHLEDGKKWHKVSQMSAKYIS